MDRKGQLKNVAFGGAWSEQIPGRETLAEAMGRVQQAVARTVEEDVRGDPALMAALVHLTRAHPKGDLMRAAWEKSLAIPHPALRSAEMARVAEAIRAWLARRIAGDE